MFKFLRLCALSCVIFTLNTGVATASCGAAFCPINTQWNTQGVWTEPGWRADLRYEYISQDQPRRGNKKVGVGQIRRHHDEIKTINQNILATLDYGFSNGWGVSGSVPLVDRSHSHIHNHGGGKIFDEWDFTEMGDAQLIGRYQFDDWNQPYVLGVYFGAKLPTGKFSLVNDKGARAERSLQAGTGTTDALLGAYIRKNFLEYQSSVFAQAIAQLPLHERHEYKPGKKLSVDVGYRYDATPRLGLMLQLNAQAKNRDSGLEAEPDDSGSHSLSISPGASYGLTHAIQLYGFVQKPLYQHVGGVQLTPEWSAITGISMHF